MIEPARSGVRFEPSAAARCARFAPAAYLFDGTFVTKIVKGYYRERFAFEPPHLLGALTVHGDLY